MALAVVGFDLGYQNSYVAVARAGGIETIANEYSDRCTTSCVSFTDTMRFVGNSARQRVVTNMKDTVLGFTKFVGKDFDDPAVQAELPYLPYKLAKTDSGGVGFRVSYLGEECCFSAEQVTAMMLTKLKSVAESSLGTPVVDCVLNVPTYYDDRERRALLDASRIAGLNCLKLINDLTAIALSYGFYKKDLPPAGEPPRNVLFVDMGHCDLQVALVAFNVGQMRILSSACDPGLGGRDLDRALFNHFAEDFASRLGIDVLSSCRAQLKLMEECARVKKLMSANSTDIPVSVECLLNERDASGVVNRADFTRLLEASGLLRRVHDCVRQCLDKAAAAPASAGGGLHSVELVGGSTRVPAVKAAVAGAVAKSQPQRPPCQTTLNADEAVARGCALSCAALSPGCRVRQYSVADCQPYSISLVAPWLAASASRSRLAQQHHVVAFPAGCDLPRRRCLRLPVSPEAMAAGAPGGSGLCFDLAAGYTNRHEVAVADRQICQYRFAADASAAAGGGKPDPALDICLRLTVELDHHGLFAVTRACLEELEPAADALSVDDDELADEEEQLMQQHAVAIRRWRLPLTVEVVAYAGARLSQELLAQCQEREAGMARHEAAERARVDARNSVEEYVYDMRARLGDGLAARLTDAERVGFADALDATEAWLYGEGEAADRQAYVERLAELRREGDAYCRRIPGAGLGENNDDVEGEAAEGGETSSGGKRPRRSQRNRRDNGATAREGDMDTDD